MNVNCISYMQLPQTLIFVLQFFTTDGERSANILHYVSLIIPTYGYVDLLCTAFAMQHTVYGAS